MIIVSNLANRIENFLKQKGENLFKIIIKLNLELDVYVFSNDIETADGYYDQFLEELGKDKTCSYRMLLGEDKLKIRPFKVMSAEDAENSFYSNLLNRSQGHIDYGPRYRFNSILGAPAIYDKGYVGNLPVVTFYSYKGGVGRTTAMMSYAIHLADGLGKNVVIVDCDLEAPGYLNFFNLSKKEDLIHAEKNGLVEFICDAQFCDGNVDVNNYVINVDDVESTSQSKGGIWVVPAGNLNESCVEENVLGRHQTDYLEGLAKIDFSNPQKITDSFQLLFEKLQNDPKIKCDVILIDSRTGFNDILGTVALGVADCVVGFFGRSRQTEPGFMNLLSEYCNAHNKFNLLLVYSILPENVNGGSGEMISFLERACNKFNVKPPRSASIHRVPMLEEIGTGNENMDKLFRQRMSFATYDSSLSDYRELFGKINEQIFPGMEEFLVATGPRDVVLQQLKKTLANVKNFAEFAKIDEELFFYRRCMQDFFDPDKFLIRGYKGTGKTYLYRALSNDKISNGLRKWAGKDDNENSSDYIFVHILPESDNAKSFNFPKVCKDKQVENPATYFDRFWKIYTWSVLLYDDGDEKLSCIRKKIGETSQLKHYISRMDSEESPIKVDEMIEDEKTLVYIEDDLKRFNSELERERKVVFTLYDRLDTIIYPTKWDSAVSALICYWRENNKKNNCILPKVFIRTDIIKQNKIRGTNIAMLTENSISLEWSVAEVFAYFFKLIISDSIARDAFWDFCKELKINNQYLDSTNQTFAKDDLYQFRSLNEAEMVPLVRAFFGTEVKTADGDYGKPWDYFEKELANADHDSISIRPFINTLRLSIDKILSESRQESASEMISPRVYASKENREKSANAYFEDLASDAFSADLLIFRQVVLTDRLTYGYTSLPERLYNSLIQQTFKQVKEAAENEKRTCVIDSVKSLSELVHANGIIARTLTSMGVFYRFAPIYWFAWGLQDSVVENEDKRQTAKPESAKFKSLSRSRLLGIIRVDQYQQVYVSVSISSRNGKKSQEFRYPIREKLPKYCQIGDLVTFHVGEEPNIKNPNKVYRFAYDIQIETQKLHEMAGKNDIPDFGSQSANDGANVKSNVRLVGIFRSNPQGCYVSISVESGDKDKKTREYKYAYRDHVPKGIVVGDLVSFSVGEEPHPYKINTVFRYAYDIRKETKSLLDYQKRKTKNFPRVERNLQTKPQPRVNDESTNESKGFWSKIWSFIKGLFVSSD